jgi:hypothetical protein
MFPLRNDETLIVNQHSQIFNRELAMCATKLVGIIRSRLTSSISKAEMPNTTTTTVVVQKKA